MSSTIYIDYSRSKKSCPFLFSEFLYENEQDLFDSLSIISDFVFAAKYG